MSNSERKQNLPAIISGCEHDFTALAKMHGIQSFTFARESSFALQALRNNDYLARVACGNQDSLKEAIINVAAIGLSLSPIYKFAYLVPRKQKVCLDISYQGYVELAVSRGVVLWAKAVLVYEDDKFQYQGVNKEPVHEFDPLKKVKERGGLRGGYVIAKLSNGDLMIDFMSIEEVFKIRDRAESWKAHISDGKSTPWATDESEMIKKTLIRRAYKSWPRSRASDVLERAVAASDDASGVDLSTNTLPPALTEDEQNKREFGLELIREYLHLLEREEPAFIAHLCRSTNRTIKELSDLTSIEINQQLAFLEALVDSQKKRLEKAEALKGKTRENAG